MRTGIVVTAAITIAIGLSVHAAPRVALVNFPTDDNSYRSAQAAANFFQHRAGGTKQ
jgi:hypothetical protein